MKWRNAYTLPAAALLSAGVSLAAWLTTSNFDTTLDFWLEDANSERWVWNATARLEGRELFSFYQSDSGLVPLKFTHLSPGKASLAVSAPGYESVAIPIFLRHGANHLDTFIKMQGFEIPNLDHFSIFERLSGEDIAIEIRPVGTDGHAVVNHPCLEIWLGAQIHVQLRNGLPVQQAEEKGITRGRLLFDGSLPCQWDSSPDAVFRYGAIIPGVKIRSDPSPYRIIDYLVVIPDPRKMRIDEVKGIMVGLPSFSDGAGLAEFFDRYKGALKYYTDTSFNVRAREQ